MSENKNETNSFSKQKALTIRKSGKIKIKLLYAKIHEYYFMQTISKSLIQNNKIEIRN